MKNVPMKGIITPILTPMNPDETVNLEVLRQQIERLIQGGVHGIFPIGTNGEAYALSFDEKLAIIETCVDQVKGRVPVYAGTGCITTRETIELSKRAADLGADILSIITPSFAVASQKEMYDHYVEVAKHVDVPIVLYNIPARTGNKLLPETVAKLAKDVDVIMGAKDSSGDWDNLQAYIRLTQDLDKGFKVLSGNDSLILKSLQARPVQAALLAAPTFTPMSCPLSTTCSWKARSRKHRPLRIPSQASVPCSSTATPTPSSRRPLLCWATPWASAAVPSPT